MKMSIDGPVSYVNSREKEVKERSDAVCRNNKGKELDLYHCWTEEITQ